MRRIATAARTAPIFLFSFLLSSQNIFRIVSEWLTP
jgi:hypothetical protein